MFSGVSISHGRAAQTLLCAVLSALFLTLSGCGGEPPPERPAPIRPVKIFEVGGSRGGGSLEYPGSVSTAQKVDMAFEVAGKIESFPVTEGQQVAVGTLLAQLDARDFQSKLDAAVASRLASKAEYDRVQALFDADVISRQELEKARRNYDLTAARVEVSSKALEDSTLRAPFSGTVARKLVKDFQNVKAKEPILIFQDDALEIVVHVPEADFARMRPGMSLEERNRVAKAKVHISSIAGSAFRASIKEFTTRADPVTRTFEATFSFQAPAGSNVKPGMTASVSIELPVEVAGKESLSLPVTAARTDGSDETFVWVIDPSSMTAHRTLVALGPLHGSFVEIESGLSDGQWVASSGVQQLREGMQVRKLDQSAAARP